MLTFQKTFEHSTNELGWGLSQSISDEKNRDFYAISYVPIKCCAIARLRLMIPIVENLKYIKSGILWSLVHFSWINADILTENITYYILLLVQYLNKDIILKQFLFFPTNLIE